MTVTRAGSIMAAFPGANNMVGKVENTRTINDTEGMTGGGGAATSPYPHDQNGTVGGSFPGPVGQPEPDQIGNV